MVNKLCGMRQKKEELFLKTMQERMDLILRTLKVGISSPREER
jgi:hypothetical protein